MIKAMVTGRELAPGPVSDRVQYRYAELRALADEAPARGLTVMTSDATCTRGLPEAVSAGFDGIEHGLIMAAQHDACVIDAIAEVGVDVAVTLVSGLRR